MSFMTSAAVAADNQPHHQHPALGNMHYLWNGVEHKLGPVEALNIGINGKALDSSLLCHQHLSFPPTSSVCSTACTTSTTSSSNVPSSTTNNDASYGQTMAAGFLHAAHQQQALHQRAATKSSPSSPSSRSGDLKCASTLAVNRASQACGCKTIQTIERISHDRKSLVQAPVWVE
jgi:hypothetical protein